MLPLVKFSGIVLAGIVGVVWVIYRSGSGEPRRWWKHMAHGGAFVGACLVAFILLTWGTHHFRAAASPDGGSFSVRDAVGLVARADIRARAVLAGADPAELAEIPIDLDRYRPPLTVRAAAWMMERKLLPDSYLAGFIYTYGTTLYRRAYLLGGYSATGWWYYFPVAFAAKTPLVVWSWLLLGLTGIVVAALKGEGRKNWKRGLLSWAWLWVPPVVYFVFSMNTRMNIGLRHLAPVYPFAWIGLGLVGGWVVRNWGKRGVTWVVASATLLGAEVLPHRLHHIQFFNLIARPHAMYLLGDSNLDWGQDLHELIDWRRRNPEVKLYAYLFLPPTDARRLGLDLVDPTRPVTGDPRGVYAISAMRLQGVFVSGKVRERLRRWRDRVPDEILPGGTIFLYRVDTPPDVQLPP